jgi:diguanylate cyclase (GGDEF)-like protein/PAS domain S-box-containing protein
MQGKLALVAWLKAAQVRWIVAANVMIGLALVGVLWWRAAYDNDRHQAVSQARLLTTRLMIEETHLKEDVLRARYGLGLTDGAINANVRRIESATRQLQAPRLPPEFTALTNRYRADAAAEEAQIEAFEAMNAVVRNALDAFVGQMRTVLPKLPDAGPNSQLQHQLGKVALDVMEQAIEVDSRGAPDARHTAALAFARAANALPNDRADFELMAQRVALIERDAPALAASVHAILDSGTRADLLAIQAQLTREARARQAIDGEEHLVGLALLVLLLGGLAAVSWRYVQALRLARQERNFLQGLNESIGVGVLVIAQDDRITFANPAAERILGFSPGELMGRHLHDGVHVREDGSPLSVEQCSIDHGVQTPGGHKAFDLFYRRRDGVVIPVSVHVSASVGEDGDGRMLVFEDISERKEVEYTLRKLSQAIEQSPASIVMTDPTGSIEYVNEAFVKHSGYSRREALGKNPRMLQSGNTPEHTYQTMWTTLLAGGTWRGELINRRKDGSEYIESAVIAPVRHDDGHVTHYIAVKDDISDRKAAEKQIQQLAFFDSLTGLPNRRHIIERIHQAVAASQRSGSFAAVMMIDIDHFKQINDTQGHDMGDRLLVQVSQRLKASVRAEDVVARLGGDEFIILIEKIGAVAEDAALRTERIGTQVLAALRLPFALDEHVDASNSLYLIDEFVPSHRTSASVGVTLFRGSEVSVETLLKQVDLALYKAKDDGRNALRFFNSEMQRVINARVELEEAIRHGLEHGEFLLHYQPQVDLHGRTIGAEALVRWASGPGIERSPAAFIPVAESSGIILPLGEWVLDAACAQLKAWEAAESTASLTMAVNISARQFNDSDFVAKVRHVVASHEVNPWCLKLELTESVLVGDVGEVAARMHELAALGIRFSLDDFGTGYSSLAYLKRMPLDQIKIDQTFVRDIEQDPSDAAIVRAIIALCDSLDIDVIAEGVETQAQKAFLVRNGCRAFQGYLFGRPMPAAQWDAFVEQSGVSRIL